MEYTSEKDNNEEDRNIHPGGLINVSVGNGPMYGIKITNNHPRLDVFLWVFYFNQNDFSIVCPDFLFDHGISILTLVVTQACSINLQLHSTRTRSLVSHQVKL